MTFDWHAVGRIVTAVVFVLAVVALAVVGWLDRKRERDRDE